MPTDNFVIRIRREVSDVLVTGRIDVQTPFYGGSTGRDRDLAKAALAKLLADRIEEAVMHVLDAKGQVTR